MLYHLLVFRFWEPLFYFILVAEKALRLGDRFITSVYLILTIVLGLFFISLQYIEYTHSSFSINDSVYGSIFFMLTGFHGFHVICGLILLTINLLRTDFVKEFIRKGFFSPLAFFVDPDRRSIFSLFRDQHTGFTASA